MASFKGASALMALAASLAAGSSLAQDASVYQEQKGLIRAPRTVAPLGAQLFGDKISYYTGALEFVQTDVSLPGNNALPVSMGRRIVTGTYPKDGRPFGRWEMEVPHLYGVFSSSKGWTTGLGTTPTLRCTNFGAPPTVTGTDGYSQWNGTDYWQGSFLYVPGHGAQELLRRGSTFTLKPSDGGTYPVVTTQMWQISCLASVAAGSMSSGEGFLAVAPDGTRYQFDYIVNYPASRLTKGNPAPTMFALAADGSNTLEASGNAGHAADNSAARNGHGKGAGKPGTPTPTLLPDYYLDRVEAWIYPTKITDRYGNTVTFTFDAVNRKQLKTITSSDGRTITLTYVTGTNLVATVSDGTRTWNYAYNGTLPTATLTTVTQPDSSTWQLSGIFSLLKNVEYDGTGACDSPGAMTGEVLTGTLTHPSGAQGTFTLTPTRNGRAGVDNVCDYDLTSSSYSPRYPYVFDTYALTKKSLSGPGLSTLEWNVQYPVADPSWAPCNGCNATKQVSVTDPSGGVTQYVFGTLYKQTEGQLQQTITSDPLAGTLRTLSVHMTEPLPGPVGVSDQRRGDGDLAARLRVQDTKTIDQQGRTFNWTGSQFDAYGRAKVVSRSSTGGPTRTETTAFYDHTAKWVLGQISSVTESSTGKVMEAHTYDASTANELSVSHFGHLDASMTYNADGTLWTRKDGKNQTTTFTNYKRGLPQNVKYANGATESAVVNNIGTVASTTDRNGYTTSYGYDAMGRLSSITYPSADVVAWNQTTLTYTRVAGTEYDLAAGHWREDIKTGNGTTSTYFDALWRPVYTYTVDTANVAGTASLVKRSFDFEGRQTYESYPKRTYAEIGPGRYTTYDALGRETRTDADSELGTLSTRTDYSYGFQKSVTNPRGKTTTYSYWTLDEPQENHLAGITAPEGVNVSFVRDIFGKTKSLTRSGLGKSATKSYVYDTYQRLCKSIEPETASTVQDYDAANNVLWRATGLALPSTTSCDTASVTAASKANFGYDSLNRLTSVTYGDGSAGITRTYKPDGLPDQVTSDGAVWTYTFNKRRLLDRESLSYSGVTYNVDRTYDANGFVSKLTYPIDNLAVTYNPNALGKPTQAGTYATNVQYHPNGAVASFTYGNGIAHTMAENTRGLPQQSCDVGVLNDVYTYDENGNVVGIADNQQSVTTRSMTYDDLDRLKTVTASSLWGTAAYSYDTLDNLTSVSLSGGTTARNMTLNYADGTTNRLMSTTGTAAYAMAYGYDIRGNITQRGTQAFVFDMANRLKSATGKGTYRYDGLGHRVSVVGTDAINRIQVYSQENKLLYQKPGTATGTKYIFLNNHFVAEVGVNGTQYDHTDALGSPVALTNATKTVFSRTRYEPFGYTAAGDTNGIGFTGHANATEVGLVYMQQRYYDPLAGRFLSIDPMTTDANGGASFNRYNYTSNNPYKYVDPDGRDFVDWVHGGLTAGSFAPSFIGAGFSAADGLVSLAQGDRVGAGISFGAAAVGMVSDAGVAKTLGAAARKLEQAAVLAENAAKGKAGEAATRAALGGTKAGEQVTIVTSAGSRTRADFVTTAQGIVETKTGGASLSSGQKQLAADVKAGTPVTPVGKNAAAAGLEPGKPVVFKDYKIDMQ